MRRPKIGILAVVAALAFAGLAFAGSPTRTQYGEGPPSPPAPSGPGLPFTGFQLTMLLLAGLATTTAGFALRASAREDPGAAVPVADAELLQTVQATVSRRCEICASAFDPHGYAVTIPGIGVFDSVACAERARAARRRTGEPARLLAVTAPDGTSG